MPIRVSHQIPDAPPARRLPDRQCLHGHSFPGGGRRSGCGRRPFVFGRRHPIWRHWPSTSASPGKAIGLVGRALSYPGHPRKMACGAKSQSPLANVRPAASVRGSGALRAVGHCQSQPSGKPQDAEGAVHRMAIQHCGSDYLRRRTQRVLLSFLPGTAIVAIRDQHVCLALVVSQPYRLRKAGGQIQSPRH